MNTSSLICKNFAQNAWKKDLCSNCFKSEVEHWPANHININEDMSETTTQCLSNGLIKMNIRNMQIKIKNDCNTSTTTSILKKSSNSSTPVINSGKKSPNHVLSNNFTIINSNKDCVRNNCNDLRKRVVSCEENNDSFHLKEGKLLTHNNKNNNNNIFNNQKCLQLRDRQHNMPLIGILKTHSTHDLIKYRPKNKCLVFKEGDPLIIGYGRTDYDGSDNSDNEDDNEEEGSDDDDDDYEECFSSDDKELKELTRENTKYNSNFANFAVNNCEDNNRSKQSNHPNEDKQLIDRTVLFSDSPNCVIDCQPINSDETIPKVCEKLVEIGINETFEAINCINQNNCENPLQTYPTNYDVIPMSTSSDSSSDEKEDSHQLDNNFSQVLTSQQTKPIESEILSNYSETDTSSTNSDSSFENKEQYRQELFVEHMPNKPKPQVPVKPNNLLLKPLLKTKSENLEIIQQKPREETVIPTDSFEESNLIEEKYLPQIVSDHIYQEVYELNDSMSGKIVVNENNNNYIVNEKHEVFNSHEKRDIKLAELAQELESVRYMKRPAPQPPKKSEELPENEDKKPIVSKQSIAVNDKQSSQHSSGSKHRFSIKKLLHKKNSSSTDKNKDHSTDTTSSTHSESVLLMNCSSDPKAWKHSEFDRNTLQIIHPIDLVVNTAITAIENNEIEAKSESPPEAPPRTPKPSRPSVPARKRNKIIITPSRVPPPPPTQSEPLPELDMSIKNNLNEAYNQLAKSNYSNLMTIKNKLDFSCGSQYKWSDFEIGNGLKAGHTMIYKDSIVSQTGNSVNLLVLENCYLTPIVSHFRHHEELVLVLDQSWSQYYLLDDLTENTFEQKQINSLILQLYSILENLENNNCNHLPSNTINSIIICSSVEDILLIVPLMRSENESIANHITLHQFLSQVLEKLLPNSLFESVAHVLSQQSVTISHSKTIVQLIAFQTPVEEIDCEVQINYWFDISRSKFINQFCVNESKLTQIDYIYLQFLCNNNTKLIRNAIALMVTTK